MIDIHTHVLPALDDGAKNEDESLLMLKAAIKDGIRTIIATSHYHPRFLNEKADILLWVENLKKIAKENELVIDILPGQEIKLFGELIDVYQSGKLLTMADQSTHLLIEFSSQHIPHYTQRLFYEIGMLGITPIIAHPERNLAFLKNPTKLYDLVKKGALTQLTAGSLLGFYGKEIRTFSDQLIEAEMAHFIGTDAHNITTRPFNLGQAYEQVTKQHGIRYTSYFSENAQKLIEGQPIYTNHPQPISKKRFIKFF